MEWETRYVCVQEKVTILWDCDAKIFPFHQIFNALTPADFLRNVVAVSFRHPPMPFISIIKFYIISAKNHLLFRAS